MSELNSPNRNNPSPRQPDPLALPVDLKTVELSRIGVQVGLAVLAEKVKDVLIEINGEVNRAFNDPKSIALKANQTIVTATDELVQTLLSEKLTGLLPGSAVLGEEGVTTDQRQCLEYFQKEFVWIIDPIDGTNNFASMVPAFAVSVGLFGKSDPGLRPMMGAVLFPRTDELIYSNGQGVIIHEPSTGKEREWGSVEAASASAQVFLGPSTLFKKFDVDHAKLKNVRQLGSTVADIVYTALGRGTGTVTGAHVWDFAGPLAIAQHLGVEFRGINSGTKLDVLTPNHFRLDRPEASWRLREVYVVSKPELFEHIRGGLRAKT